MTGKGAEWRGFVALLAGATCIGFAPLWVRWSEVGPVSTAFWRLFLAVPVLTLMAARETRSRPGRRDSGRAVWGWLLASGLFFALDMATWHVSIRLTTIANACLLGNLAPVFVALGAWVLLSQRPARGFWWAVLLTLAGAWLLTGANFRGDPQRWRGDVLAAVTAVYYGGYQLSVARLGRDLGPARLLAISSGVSAVALIIFALWMGESIWPATARGWGVLIGLALTAQVAGQGLITYGFSHVPAGVASLTLVVQTVVAALAGWLLFGERLTPLQFFGGCILIAGLLLARRRVRSGSGSSDPQD